MQEIKLTDSFMGKDDALMSEGLIGPVVLYGN